MDWLNDRKNLPLIAAICTATVLGAVFCILWSQGYLSKIVQANDTNSGFVETGNSRFLPQVPKTNPVLGPAVVMVASNAGVLNKGAVAIRENSATTTPIAKTKASASKASAMAKPPIAQKPSLVTVPPVTRKPLVVATARPATAATVPSGKPGAPAAVAKAPAEPPLTSESVLHGKDPFNIPGLRRPIMVASAPRATVPELNIYRFRPRTEPLATIIDKGSEQADPLPGGRRVSGIMYNNGVYALLEANGQTYTVQPGDQVEGDRVISIQSDGLMLRTSGNLLVHVPLNGGSVSNGGQSNQPMSDAPVRRGPPPGAAF